MTFPIRSINRVLLIVTVTLWVYFYFPVAFGEDGVPQPASRPSDAGDIEELRRQVKALQEKFDQLQTNLPDVVKTEVTEVRKQEKKDEKLKEQEWREQSHQSKWNMAGGPLRHNLSGRALVGPGPDYSGSYGVLFDVNSGSNISSKEGAERVNFYKARITPFIQLDTWGAQMAMNVRKFLHNEVIKGELRDQVSNQDFESAYVYYRAINEDQVEVVAYVGQVNEPFIREVVDQSVFTNRSIMDKYRLNTSMALRVDLGLGRTEGINPKIVERPIWIQAASFNLDKDNKDFADFAGRVILSLSIINKFANFDAVDLSAIQLWGGFAQVKSGQIAGELPALSDPTLSQRMAVFGLQFDLVKLTGKDLGVIYSEFVYRRRSGEIKDTSWVIGYEIKIPMKEKGYRPMEVGIRYQQQTDDPDFTVSDGSILQGSFFYPLTAQNIGIRLNAGYIIRSTDPDRDGKLIFSAEIEVLW